MPRQRIVTLGGAAGFTAIRATMPCHTLKVYQDGVRDKAFTYKRRCDDTQDVASGEGGFTTEFTTQAGDPIVIVGHGRGGILGRPPHYCGWNAILAQWEPEETAAAADDSGGGDIILYVKAADDSTPDVVVIESESEF